MECKVESCKNNLFENGYCKRHKKFFIKEQMEAAGKQLCSNFARGCLNEITEKKYKACESCREKVQKKDEEKRNKKNIIKNKLEKTDGKKICSNFARGCRNTVDKHKACETCRETCRDKDRKCRKKKQEIDGICNKCGVKFDHYITKNGTSGVKCPYCMKKQQEVDKNRPARHRDWVQEMKNNPERKAKRLENSRIRSKHMNYYENCRAKKIEKLGLKEYRKQQAQRMVDYRKNNPGYVKKLNEKQRNDPHCKFLNYKKRAKSLNILFDLTEEETYKFFNDECFYCGINEKISGIDRTDNNDGYVLDNCVSCCTTCNMMKTCLDINTFIKRCENILIYQNVIEGSVDYEISYDTLRVSYSGYINSATRREKSFNLSKEQFNSIINNDCYICGKSNVEKIHQNGIDRYDNEIGYELDNCKACCGECNHMKKDLDFPSFLTHVEKIHYNCINMDYIDYNYQNKSIVPSGRVKMSDDEIREAGLKLHNEKTEKMNKKYCKENQEISQEQCKENYRAEMKRLGKICLV
jgi:hypothetical protein